MSKKTYCPALDPDTFDEKVRTERLLPIVKVDPMDPGIGYFRGPNSTLQARLRHTACLACRHCAFSHDAQGCAIPGCSCERKRLLGTFGWEDGNPDLQGLPRSHTKKDWGDLQGRTVALQGKPTPSRPQPPAKPKDHPWKKTLGKADEDYEGPKDTIGIRSHWDFPRTLNLPRTRTQE